MRTSQKQVNYYINILNNYLKEKNINKYYKLENRNGYYAIDIYKNGCSGCNNLDCGLTLKECYIIIKNACDIVYEFIKEDRKNEQ